MTTQPSEQPLSFWEALGAEYWECQPVPAPPDRTSPEYTKLKEEYETYLEYMKLKAKYGGTWRYLQQLKSGSLESDPQEYQNAREECEKAEAEFREYLCQAYLHKKRRSALCLSGGGIRSAIFGLGVLQGLAKHSWKKHDTGEHGPKLLSEFDYLSTVSGGGYVGSWFSAWAQRERKAPRKQQDSEPQIVPENALSPEQAARAAQEKAEQQVAENMADGDAVKQVIEGLVAAPDADPVFHLRRYSNYLTPQMGFLSADTWTWVATFIRNMFLNWLVALPVVAAVLLIPKVSMDLAKLPNVPDALGWCIALIGIFAGAAAYAYLILELPSAGNRDHRQGAFLGLCLLPLSIFAWCLSLTGYWLLENPQELEQWKSVLPRWPYADSAVSAFLTLALLVLLLGTLASLGVTVWNVWKENMSFAGYWNRLAAKLRAQMNWLGKASFGLAFTTVVAGVTIYLLFTWLHPILASSSSNKSLDTKLYTVFAFPLVLVMVIVTQALLVGLVSGSTTDNDREWWGRAGGWLYLAALGWMIGSALVLFAGDSLTEVRHAGRWVAASVLSSFSLGGIASALGFSSKTQAVDMKIPLAKISKSQKARKWVLQALLLVFLLLLVPALASATTKLGAWVIDYWKISASNFRPLQMDALLALLFLVVSFAMASCININKFSLHGMYRARLIRAFLGASNRKRRPNWFTGFDPNDNLSMHDLLKKPLHVINMTLNLVTGGELAWQDRKAESFTSSAMHTGSMWLGYQPSDKYGRVSKLEDEPDRISLGSSVAVSGAAATPNMGYHSSPLLTAVMTLFNARLGAWRPNPGEAGRQVWDASSPTLALSPFYDEALGLTNDTHEWVYLSDGGHFENLGLYEMVARRCHYILAIDAGCDGNYQCDDLIQAMRKIRTDLGIPIEFSDGLPFSTTGEKKGKHYAIGHIHYSHVDPGAEPGILVYVKPALVGNEPRDVVDYHRQHSNFPQQPTTDQWFDESQFESYRCLGEFVIHEILHEEESHSPAVYSLQEFFTIAEKGKLGILPGKFKAAIGL